MYRSIKWKILWLGWLGLLTAPAYSQGTHGNLYLEPVIGLQYHGGGFQSKAPYLSNSYISFLSYGGLLRWQPAGRFEYSVGAVLGAAGLGFRLTVPPHLLVPGTVSPATSQAMANSVWHLPLRIGYRAWHRPLGQQPGRALSTTFVIGPQLDYRVSEREGQLKLVVVGGPNILDYNRVLIDSARWSGSLYLGAQWGYESKGRERLRLELYGIIGFTPMLSYRLDYQVNQQFLTTTIHARTSTVGLRLSVPIRLWPLGRRAAVRPE